MGKIESMREVINRPEWVKRQYQDDSKLNARIALHKRFSTTQVPWSQWVLDRVAEELERQFGTAAADGYRLLEIGCGPGSTWADSPHHRVSSWRPVLSDLSPGMVSAARRNLAGAGVDATLLVANAEHIPIAAGSFHGVIANHMLYHVQDRARAIEDIRRVLLPGGVLIAATNGDGHMQELWDLAHRFDPAQVAEDPSPRKFSLESGARQLSSYFKVVNIVHHENQLVVTEAQPLADYMLSGVPVGVGAEKEAALRSFVGSELAKQGTIRITPVTGLLIAHD